LKIVVDAEVCEGHGRCYLLAPELFSADELGHSVVNDVELVPELENLADRAAQNCPERAITIER
jgi:ferredoxin